MDFRILPIPISEVEPLMDLPIQDLADRGCKLIVADSKPGYPCRVSLQDAEIGKQIILMPYHHHATYSSYRSSGPVFIRVGATQADLGINEIPVSVSSRLLSVRGYDVSGDMLDAEVTEGKNLRETISVLFANSSVSYLHIHNAKPGCYSCKVVIALIGSIEISGAYLSKCRN